MKATARLLLSATTALGLTVFTVLATSASVAAASFGLLVVYGLVEMTIRSYAPRPVPARHGTPRPVVKWNAATPVPAMVEFPNCSLRSRAA